MTSEIPVTSIPRAAMSVAISTRYLPDLNPESALFFARVNGWSEFPHLSGYMAHRIGNSFGAVFGTRKNQHTARVVTQQFFQKLQLHFFVGNKYLLFDVRRGGAGWRHFDSGGIFM